MQHYYLYYTIFITNVVIISVYCYKTDDSLWHYISSTQRTRVWSEGRHKFTAVVSVYWIETSTKFSSVQFVRNLRQRLTTVNPVEFACCRRLRGDRQRDSNTFLTPVKIRPAGYSKFVQCVRKPAEYGDLSVIAVRVIFRPIFVQLCFA